MFFAELGARVIKIENPRTGGDITRQWKLKSESNEVDFSAYFSCTNWGKESLALDLENEFHRSIFYKLVKKADIVIQNFKAGVAERFEVDYDHLIKIRPDLIYAEITAYGKHDSRPGFDAIIQAESGFTYMNGSRDCKPEKMPVALIDLLTAHQVKEAILLAMIKRLKTGEGSFISASLMKSAVASLANQAANWLVAGGIPQRTGSEHPNIAPYGTIFSTKDCEEFVIACGTDRQFKKLCDILGLQLYLDPRFINNAVRVKNRTELNQILIQQFEKYSRNEILKKLHELGIPAGPLNKMDQVFETPDAREILFKHSDADGNNIQGVRTFICEGGASPENKPVSPPPQLNANAQSILQNDLDFSAKEIKKYRNTLSIKLR